nr:hypothetical protein [Leptolyngbya sp. Prado105]
CRAVPDISVNGKLSSVHLFIDNSQYKLIRGVLAHNFGEQLEEFQSQLMSHLKDPKTQSVLSGMPTKGLSVCLQLEGVRVELLLARDMSNGADSCLAEFDFQRTVLQFESQSDGTKDIDLVSHEIVISDTRFRAEPVNVRPNVFTDILKPSANHKDRTALQLELRSSYHWAD